VSGRSALFAVGAIAEPPVVLDATLPWGDHNRDAPWVRIRTTTWAVPVLSAGERLRVAIPSLALVLAHEVEPPATRASLVHEALRSPLVSAQEVATALDHLKRIGGRRSLLTRLARASDGAESYLEERAHVRVLTGSRLSSLLRQHWLNVPGGPYRADAYDERTRTAVEFDGAGNHAGPENWQRDLRRDTDLAAVGIHTARFSYADVVGRPAWCRERLLAILRARER
jgi:very-short-patch-repair endonuclease